MTKKNNTRVLLLLVLLFATILLMSPVCLNEKNEELDDLNSSLYIKAVSINGNAQLSAAASAGNGTKANPYILGGYVNQTISIANTNAYFILRNCTYSHISAPYENFKFDNITNGIIVNNTYSYCSCGSGYRIFQLLNSDNNTFVNNTMVYNSGNADNMRGLYMSNSDGNLIMNNYFCNNWQEWGGDCYIVEIHSSDSNNFTQNKICNNLGIDASSHAFWMTTSNDNIISQNWICDNCNLSTGSLYCSYGIQINGANNSVTWNMIHNNTVPSVIGDGNTVQDNDWHKFELITNGQVSPSTGDNKKTYTYSITYTDLNNTAPSFVRVIIDGTPFNMSKQTTSDNDYTDGCIYQYKTSMDVGNHNYRFEASNGTDSERLVFIGYYSGPEVSEHKGVPGFILLYGTIGVFAVALIYLRRRKSYQIF